VSRKTALNIARNHEQELDSKQATLELPGAAGADYLKTYKLAHEALARVPSVRMVPTTPAGKPTGMVYAPRQNPNDFMYEHREHEERSLPEAGGRQVVPVDEVPESFDVTPQPDEPVAPADPMVNVWLEGAEEPLRVGTAYRVAIDVGKPRDGALASEPLAPPGSAEEEELALTLVLSGKDVMVRPPVQNAVLHRRDGMKAVFFDVTLLRAGRPEFFVSVFLARELVLLQKIRIVLHDVVEEAAAVEP
jgi:hypothetical protein